jgi:hypothetical protein
MRWLVLILLLAAVPLRAQEATLLADSLTIAQGDSTGGKVDINTRV